MTWAEKIRCIENELGMSEERGLLARILGIRSGRISEIKSGKIKNPAADIPLLLISLVGVNPEWLNKEEQPIFINKDWLKRQPHYINVISELKKQPFNAEFCHEPAGGEEKQITLPNDEKNNRQKANILASPSLPDTPTDGIIESPQREALVVVDGGVEQGLLIPVMAQGLSAGFGFDYEEGEIVRYIKVPAWLAREGRNLVAVPVYGESMEPTLSKGDLAVCDLGGFKDDGVYALRDGERGLMFCKRVIWAPGGWTIVSDNAKYEPMKVDDRAIEVVARVIAAIKEVK